MDRPSDPVWDDDEIDLAEEADFALGALWLLWRRPGAGRGARLMPMNVGRGHEAPIGAAVRQPLQMDLRVDQDQRGDLEPASQERQAMQTQLEPLDRREVGVGGTGDIGDAELFRHQVRRRQ